MWTGFPMGSSEMTKLKEIICTVCRLPNGKHSFNQLTRCKTQIEMAHVALLMKYNEQTSEVHELNDK